MIGLAPSAINLIPPLLILYFESDRSAAIIYFNIQNFCTFFKTLEIDRIVMVENFKLGFLHNAKKNLDFRIIFRI